MVSSTYELPVGKNKEWLKTGVPAAMFGGWSLAMIGVLQQGSPIQLNTQTNTTNAFTPGAQRVNVLRDPNLPADQRSLSRWFDTSAVAAPSAKIAQNGCRVCTNYFHPSFTRRPTRGSSAGVQRGGGNFASRALP